MSYTSNKVINDLEAKTTPVDADSTVIGDSADSNRAKKTTWANIKATLKTYFDTVYTNGTGTADEIAYWSDGDTVSSLTTATYPSKTELSYVKGVTSAIQTQIGTKAPSTAPTFATSITGSYLTASEILITDADKKIVSAPVATYPSLTELTYVKGVTSAIQTQINAIGIPTYKNGTTSKNAADASETQNIAHGLGVIPKKVRIKAISEAQGGGGDSIPAISETVYNGTTQSSVSMYSNGTGFSSGAAIIDTSFTLNISGAGGTQTGVVTFDATNIIITWTKTNSPTGTYTLLWEAEI